jgi:hypothetical protein
MIESNIKINEKSGVTRIGLINWDQKITGTD